MADGPNERRLKPIDVFENIRVVQSKYLIFGLKLGLEKHEIDINCRGDQSDCLLQVLIEFEKRAGLTWKPIIDALKSPALNFNTLAKSIEDKFCQQNQGGTIISSNNTSAPTGIEDESLAPGNCSATNFITPDFYTEKELSDLQKEIDRLDEEFHRIKNETREHLEKNCVPLKHVTDALTSLKPYEGGLAHDKLFLDENLEKIVNAKTHIGIFARMNLHWDYLNYHLLDVVIIRLNVVETSEIMAKYISEIKSFMKMTQLALFCRVNKEKPQLPENFKKIAASFNWPKEEDVTLDAVDQFRVSFSNHYGLKDFAILLNCVRPGSYVVTWLVHKSVVDLLLSNIPLKLFEQSFVFKFTVGEEVLYSKGLTQVAYDLRPPFSPESGYGSRATPELDDELVCVEAGVDGDCREYKFTGKCYKHELGECRFIHRRSSKAYEAVLKLPRNITPLMAAGFKRCNLKRLYNIYDCFIKIDKEKVTILTDQNEKLKLLADEMELILYQEGVSGPAKCYIHHQGLNSQAIYLFKPYKGRVPVRTKRPNIQNYVICQEFKQEMSDEDEIVERLAAMNPLTEDDTKEGLHRKLMQIHGDVEDDASRLRWTQKTRIHRNPKEDILKFLRVGLALLCDKGKKEGILTNLTVRFGRIIWSNFSEDTYGKLHSAQKLTELLFDRKSEHISVFNTDVQGPSAEVLNSSLISKRSHTLETYDVKVTTLGEVGGEKGARLDIRLLVRGGDNPSVKVVKVKKNETKDLTFDILQLHRKHDFRVCLQHYKCVDEREPLYELVKDVVSKISFLSPHKLSFQCQNTRWNVPFIRHKIINTYDIGGGFAITIAKLAEWNKDESPPVFDTTINNHTEVELHNLGWECTFGHDGGLSPTQSLALYMEEGMDAEEFDRIHYPWNPDSILQGFDTYWAHIEKLIMRLENTQ